MAMRVPGSLGNVETRASETTRREVNESSDAGPASVATVKSGEAVVTAARSQEIKASTARAESARAEKLERIAAQLADGSYKVDFAAVAERLVDDELSRFGAPGAQ
jgi:flagellar biosynthesis anti-sigma factor FlgM